jgi:DNA repair photolyase
MYSNDPMIPSEEDLQEIYALFTSPADEEVSQIYDETSEFHFRKENLAEEYSLTQEKREFAVDAWRAVNYFLQRHGCSLVRDGVRHEHPHGT